MSRLNHEQKTVGLIKHRYADIQLDLVILYTVVLPLITPVYAEHDKHIVIISQNQGLATPLEKIAKYYGLVILISLIVILLITFFVIWLKTNQNIAWAAFDILRLLINSDVTVPLNTLSIKIFFSMIFLYFLILHTTFSGHLAEFLTIPKSRDKIDLLKDLKDSRITKIYTFGLDFDHVENFETLHDKLTIIKSTEQFLNRVVEDPSSACVGSKYSLLFNSIKNGIYDKVYFSKDVISVQKTFMFVYSCFSHQERFSWLFLTASEIGLANKLWNIKTKQVDYTLSKKIALAEIDFRPIALTDLKFAFIFLLVGNSLGIICFLIELLVGRGLPQQNIILANFCKVLTQFKKVTQNIVESILALKVYALSSIRRN